MNRFRAVSLLFLAFLSGCAKESQTTNSNSTPPSLALSESAQHVEEKLVRGETIGETDIQGLSSSELRILRNACFARHGRKYESAGLGDYFNNCPWYKPREDYNDNLLTAVDRANVKLIQAAEQRVGAIATSNANSSTANSINLRRHQSCLRPGRKVAAVHLQQTKFNEQ